MDEKQSRNPKQAVFDGNYFNWLTVHRDIACGYALTNRKGLVHILQAGAAGVAILCERLDTEHILGAWGEVTELD